MKIRSRARIEPGGLEIELQAAQLVEREIAEVVSGRWRRGTAPRAAARAPCSLAELAEVADVPPEPPRRAVEHRRGQRPRVVRAHEVAQRAGPSSSR